LDIGVVPAVCHTLFIHHHTTHEQGDNSVTFRPISSVLTIATTLAGVLFANAAHAQSLTLRSDLLQNFNSYLQNESVPFANANLFQLNPNTLRFEQGLSDVAVFFVNEGAGYRSSLSYSANSDTPIQIFSDL
jgi:hypothetical protein